MLDRILHLFNKDLLKGQEEAVSRNTLYTVSSNLKNSAPFCDYYCNYYVLDPTPHLQEETLSNNSQVKSLRDCFCLCRHYFKRKIKQQIFFKSRQSTPAYKSVSNYPTSFIISLHVGIEKHCELFLVFLGIVSLQPN